MRPESHVATLMILVSLVSLSSARSEPLVLYDSGQVQAIDPFMEPLRPKPQPEAPTPPVPGLRLNTYGLPVRTPSMTPGKVLSRSLPMLQGKMGGATPFFLIGADQLSLQWLQLNRARLLELQAVGMVVSVDRETDLDVLRQAAGALQLVPASAETWAKTFGLRHYPVLIAPPGVVAQ